VAYETNDGRLLTTEWHVETQDAGQVLVMTVPTSQFHIEYYLDAITSGKETVIKAKIPLPEAPVASATLTVQQPANTSNFRGDPPLGKPEAGVRGLMYASRTLGALPSGAVVSQEVRYTRLAPGLSTTPRAAAPSVPTSSASSQTRPAGVSEPHRNWIPLLMAVLLVIAIGGAIVFWMRKQSDLATVSPPSASRRTRRKRSPARTALPKYCPNCGYPFESDDRYCAMCGTKRE